MNDYYDYYTDSSPPTFNPLPTIISLALCVFVLVCMWIVFRKAGKPGWAAIVTFYNLFVLFDITWGSGMRVLLLLIPIYNIYFVIKMNIDWAKAFNQGVGFGIGLLLLPFIFQLILAFGGDQYRDGSYTNTQPDMVENVVSKAKDAVSGNQDDHKEQ